MSRFSSLLFVFCFVLLGFAVSASQASANLNYGSGTYTNLCGTGTAASADTCNRGCNTGSGTCSSSGSNVVKYTCSGRQTECKSNESGFSSSQSVGASCGQTVQLDVFNKNCRVNGQWVCSTSDLQDYMVWYSGDCAAQPTSKPVTKAPTKIPTATKAPTSTPNPTQTIQPTATPIPTAVPRSTCDALDVIEGNNTNVPANVLLRARASDSQGTIQNYRFFFGDGAQSDSTNPEIRHTYEASGNFVARVDAQDSRGVWKTSSACQRTVTVKAVSIESHKSACSDIHFMDGYNMQAPTTGKFEITGFDNKGAIKKYKIDFGNGITKESESPNFEQVYDKAGTYTIRAYILDSTDNWVGDTNNCHRLFYVNTEPLKSQPKTGTSTTLTLIGLSGGIVSMALFRLRSQYLAKSPVKSHRHARSK